MAQHHSAWLETSAANSNDDPAHKRHELRRWFDRLSEESESEDNPIKESDATNGISVATPNLTAAFCQWLPN